MKLRQIGAIALILTIFAGFGLEAERKTFSGRNTPRATSNTRTTNGLEKIEQVTNQKNKENTKQKNDPHNDPQEKQKESSENKESEEKGFGIKVFGKNSLWSGWQSLKNDPSLPLSLLGLDLIKESVTSFFADKKITTTPKNKNITTVDNSPPLYFSSLLVFDPVVNTVGSLLAGKSIKKTAGQFITSTQSEFVKNMLIGAAATLGLSMPTNFVSSLPFLQSLSPLSSRILQRVIGFGVGNVINFAAGTVLSLGAGTIINKVNNTILTTTRNKRHNYNKKIWKNGNKTLLKKHLSDNLMVSSKDQDYNVAQLIEDCDNLKNEASNLVKNIKQKETEINELGVQINKLLGNPNPDEMTEEQMNEKMAELMKSEEVAKQFKTLQQQDSELQNKYLNLIQQYEQIQKQYTEKVRILEKKNYYWKTKSGFDQAAFDADCDNNMKTGFRNDSCPECLKLLKEKKFNDICCLGLYTY